MEGGNEGQAVPGDGYEKHLAFCWNRFRKSESHVMPWDACLRTPFDVFSSSMQVMPLSGNMPLMPKVHSSANNLEVGPELSKSAFREAKLKFATTADNKLWHEKLSWERKCAYKKWCSLILTNVGAWQISRQVAASGALNFARGGLMDSVSDALANKASSTLHNRAGPLIRFAKFWRDRGCECFPVEEPMLYEYFKSWTNAAPSSFRSLLLSISFAFHILGLMGGEVVLKSGRIKGLSAAHFCNRRKVVQRPPLTVEQVQHLEQIVKDERRTAFDRIAAGYFLLLIFGRLRFSDGLHISSMKLDVITVGTDLEGFLECEAERTKTSITLERKTRHLPIAVPILGFSDPSWVLTWLELRDKAGLKCERGTPLMTSPMADGSWSKTPLPVSSAGEWLRALLKVSDGAAVRIATHSCKSTLLSMCSKFGLEHSVRRMLGYHSCSKDKSLLVYSRDSMSLPLRRLREVIMAVRTDMFFPDKTRSGYFAPGSTCESNQPASDDDGSLDSESRGSESEEDDIPEEEEKAVAQVVGPWRPQEATDSLCYARHKTSRCLHVLADEGGTHFRCGRTANANYLRLDEKPEFVYPACGVCLKL